MDEPAERHLPMIAGGALLAIAVVLMGLTLLGGQTSKILSTVGNSVGGTSSGEEPAPAPTAAPTVAAGRTGGQLAATGPTVPTLLIVRTGTLELEVADLDGAVRSADVAVAGSGGYVSSSERAATGDAAVAAVSYRIPSTAWDATLERLHGVASRVVAEKIATDEVSGQVFDLSARITNLRATEAALQAIMARATKISDVLDVQGQLTTTRDEIEKLVGDKTHLANQAAFGSLAVTFRLPPRPVPSATPLPVKGWDPGLDASRATNKLVRIGQTSTSIGIWLAIVGLPLLIGATIVIVVAWQVYRLGRWVAGRRWTEGRATG